MITLEFLQKLCPASNAVVDYIEPLNSVMAYYDMFDNELRTAGFLAQIIHESGEFKFIVENLKYSATGLMKTFPRYFQNVTVATQYQYNQVKIANKVYANRMGNGPASTGDGYKYRGRGLIQITGKQNYTKLADDLEMTVDATIAYLGTPNGATSSAGWFWDNNNLNSYCDANDFVNLTKRINGGTNGIDHRRKYFDLALKYIRG